MLSEEHLTFCLLCPALQDRSASVKEEVVRNTVVCQTRWCIRQNMCLESDLPPSCHLLPPAGWRFQHFLKKYWACLIWHACVRRHSQLWTLTRAAWGWDYTTFTCVTSVFEPDLGYRPQSQSQYHPFKLAQKRYLFSLLKFQNLNDLIFLWKPQLMVDNF